MFKNYFYFDFLCCYFLCYLFYICTTIVQASDRRFHLKGDKQGRCLTHSILFQPIRRDRSTKLRTLLVTLRLSPYLRPQIWPRSRTKSDSEYDIKPDIKSNEQHLRTLPPFKIRQNTKQAFTLSSTMKIGNTEQKEPHNMRGHIGELWNTR